MSFMIVDRAVGFLIQAAEVGDRNLQMPGDGRYQPEDAQPYLGYDQWAGWLVLVEWFWMKALAKMGAMPKEDAKLLTEELLRKMLNGITTTVQDEVENGRLRKRTRGNILAPVEVLKKFLPLLMPRKDAKVILEKLPELILADIAKRQEELKKAGRKDHDIIALLIRMRQYLPERLWRWLHLCATSYDIICTAYALQLFFFLRHVFYPKLQEVDVVWREIIKKNAELVKAGRTHLMTALPITAGFEFSDTHNRFNKSGRKLYALSGEVVGKFSGATGTYASQRALLDSREGESILMRMLGLQIAEASTQIAPPESVARCYSELVLLSGSLANLGENGRILQSSQFGELISVGSTSSAMSHKAAGGKAGNPIAAENLAGMHESVKAEFGKVQATLVSALQRDLRWSNVMRSHSAVAVYSYQQALTVLRLLKNLKVNSERCWENFNRESKLVPAELLHLALQQEGFRDAHQFVNKEIVRIASFPDKNLVSAMDGYVEVYGDDVHGTDRHENLLTLKELWDRVKPKIVLYLTSPAKYIGYAVEIAEKEAENKL